MRCGEDDDFFRKFEKLGMVGGWYGLKPSEKYESIGHHSDIKVSCAPSIEEHPGASVLANLLQSATWAGLVWTTPVTGAVKSSQVPRLREVNYEQW